MTIRQLSMKAGVPYMTANRLISWLSGIGAAERLAVGSSFLCFLRDNAAARLLRKLAENGCSGAFTKQACRLTGHLLKRLGRGDTVRQCAISAGVPYMTAGRILRELEKHDIITSRKVGSSMLCMLNLKSEAACSLMALCSLPGAGKARKQEKNSYGNSADSCVFSFSGRTYWIGKSREDKPKAAAEIDRQGFLDIRRKRRNELAAAEIRSNPELFWRLFMEGESNG